MIVECSTCGTKNRLPDSPKVGRAYHCAFCKTAIEPPEAAPEQVVEGNAEGPSSQVWETSYSNDSDISEKVVPAREAPSSAKRLLGAALFGCLVAGYATNACDFTLPIIISMVHGVDEASAVHQYSSSAIFPFLKFGLSAVLGSAVAAFLARRRALLAGLLACLPFACFLLGAGVIAAVRGDIEPVGEISYQLYEFLLFATVAFAATAGARIGQRVYSKTSDPDLNQDKVTIFGVRWGHYFWILPLVVYPYLASLMMAAYAGVLAFLATYYVALHPSLWFSFDWLGDAMLNPIAIYCAFWLVFQGFARFLHVMTPRLGGPRRLAKFWRVLLYGFLAPDLSFTLARISAGFTHSLPRPTPGDWKIGLAIVGGLAVISLVGRTWSWVMNGRRSRTGSEPQGP